MAADVRAVDRELEEFVVQRLSDSRFAAAVAAARSDVADRLAEVRREIAECEKLQKALSDRLGRRELSLDAFDAANSHLVADLERLTTERDQLTGGVVDGPVTAEGADEVRARWKASDVPGKRALLTSALQGGFRVVVHPAAKDGKRSFDRRRITVDPPVRTR